MSVFVFLFYKKHIHLQNKIYKKYKSVSSGDDLNLQALMDRSYKSKVWLSCFPQIYNKRPVKCGPLGVGAINHDIVSVSPMGHISD